MITRSSKAELQPTSRIQPVVRLINTLKFPKRMPLGTPNHKG